MCNIAHRMYSVLYLDDDISDETDSSLVDKARDGDHVKYRDHLGVLTRILAILVKCKMTVK